MSAVLDAEQAGWILRGATTITLASSDQAHAPSLGQGIGCRIDAQRRCMTVFLLEPRNTAVLADLRAGRALAVVFTNSSTLRSLQLKARSAREVELEPGDDERITAFIGAAAQAFSSFGVDEQFAHVVMPRAPGKILAFTFEPYVGFDQTPGPHAGTPLLPGTA